MRAMKRTITAIASVCFAFGAAAATPEEDVQRYVQIFEQPSGPVELAVDELGWKGISDTRVYDLIEGRLLQDAAQASRSKVDRNRVNRSIKALGFSGQAKYEPTLATFAGERAYGAYAKRAMENLKQYARWNPIIADRSTWDPQYPDDVNRVRNMLRSNDLELQRIGAKRVFYTKSQEPVLLDLVADRLRDCYKTAGEGEAVDVAGWMVNALGIAATDKYRPLLEEVARGAASDKVQRRAGTAARR
jgi:hypothetical protein